MARKHRVYSLGNNASTRVAYTITNARGESVVALATSEDDAKALARAYPCMTGALRIARLATKLQQR